MESPVVRYGNSKNSIEGGYYLSVVDSMVVDDVQGLNADFLKWIGGLGGRVWSERELWAVVFRGHWKLEGLGLENVNLFGNEHLKYVLYFLLLLLRKY